MRLGSILILALYSLIDCQGAWATTRQVFAKGMEIALERPKTVESPLRMRPRTIEIKDPSVRGRIAKHPGSKSSFLGRSRLVGMVERDFSQEVALREAQRFFIRMSGDVLTDEALILRSLQRVDSDWVIVFKQASHGFPLHGTHAVAVVDAHGLRFAHQRFVVPPKENPKLRLIDVQAMELAQSQMMHYSYHARPRGTPVLEMVLNSSQNWRLAWRIRVDTQEPWGTWDVYLDAETGATLGRELYSRSGVEGVVNFRVEPFCQNAGVDVLPVPNIHWSDGRYANDSGEFSSPDTLSQAEVRLKSPYFILNNRAGGLAGPWYIDLNPSPAQNEIEVLDAPFDQIDPFYFLHRVRSWLRGRVDNNNSQKRWTEQQVGANININSSCNAYYNGEVNFFAEGGGCLNTGRSSTIVYHEYGHGIHDHSNGPSFDIQVSEGISDFTAATINNSPKVVGLHSCSSSFRTCSNNYTYCNSGCTYGPNSEVHATGQVLCAVLWEFRSLLIERYGYDLGVSTTDRIFLKFLTIVDNMYSAYDAAIAADDDNDGDPSNGTTHTCELNKAFANDEDGAVAHFPDLVGMIAGGPSAKIIHDPPGLVEATNGDPLRLEFDISIDPGCAGGEGDIDSAQILLHYQPKGGQEAQQVMEKCGTTANGTCYVAVLPTLELPVTVEYYAVVRLPSAEFIYPYQGGNRALQNIAGWPHYRQVVHFGKEDTLYFSDFESDDGGLVGATKNEEGQDDDLSDWEWGQPNSLGGGPEKAVSGQKIWATDLDGQYGHDRESILELPAIDASRYEMVRLQFWRQLLNSDVARVEVNGTRAFEHRSGAFFWRDPLWIFQDIDISALAAGQDDVRIRVVIRDEFVDSFELAGWHIDDVRVAGILAPDTPADQENSENSIEESDSGTSSCGPAHKGGFLMGWVAFLFFWLRCLRNAGKLK